MRSMTTIALALALAPAACDRGVELDTRTFRLQHLRPLTAEQLVHPYVYGDREGAPGTLSVTEGALSVRETPDNLDKIERLLDEYDRPQADVRLHFQLIEADGFQGTDPAIADVVTELRRVLQFEGYRLAGEAFVSATDGSELEQRLQTADASYLIQGQVYRAGPQTLRLNEIELWRVRGEMLLGTTVNVRPGQTLVLGSSPKEGTATTLLITVRAEEVAQPTN